MDIRHSLCLAFLLSVATVMRCAQPPMESSTEFVTVLTSELILEEGITLPPTSEPVPQCVDDDCDVNQVCNETKTGCVCVEGYQRNETTDLCEVILCGTVVCNVNQTCNETNSCVCVDDYQRNETTGICEATTCLIPCGEHGTCIGDGTTSAVCQCDHFSLLEEGVCVARTCNNSCKYANQNCSDGDGGNYTCTCEAGYKKVTDDLACEARTCVNSCVYANQTCSDEDGGYNCTCIAGYMKVTDDQACVEISVPTTTPGFSSTEAVSTFTTGSAKSPTPGAPQTTKAPSTAAQTTSSTATVDVKPAPTSASFTGAIVGLFIFLVATSFVFVSVYLVRRRKLRNNYGRLDEDTEGDSGWSAFSKNPIYRGDKDYQPL